MKTLIQFIAIYTLLFLIYGCNNSSEVKRKYDGAKPERVVISGKVLNPFDDINTVSVILNDPPTARQLTFTDDINFQDSTFHISFERYLPQDVMIKYGSIFKVFVHPGDSLHIEFDANHLDYKPLLYNSLKFTGDPARFNKLLAIYYSHYHQNQPDFNELYEFQQTCTADEIIQFRDSVRQFRLKYLKEFEDLFSPSDELKTFIKHDIEMDYVNNLALYPGYYALANKLNQYEVVPLSFYDFLKIPIPKEALINTNASRYFINRYRFSYVMPQLRKKLIDERIIIDTIINGKPEIIRNIDNDSA